MMGLWEDKNELVGIACYEMDIGECFISIKQSYETLLPEIISYSENNLFKKDNDKKILSVWVTDKEERKIKLLEKAGYQKVHSEPVTIFPYEKSFPERKLPKGFSVLSLEDECDLKKVHDCIWYGFDHGPEPDPEEFDERTNIRNGPNFRNDLTTIIKSPDGKYACFAGMYMDEQNKYAYLEPLATIPEYRRLGLATIALVEGMKKTKALGAKYCFGGTREFYHSIGFETIGNRELGKKEW
jgi:ribosomal protein S18 acetylase RimI-like enzyme